MTYTTEFLKFLISHYTTRLAEETRPDGKRFLRQTLFNLKKSVNDK